MAQVNLNLHNVPNAHKVPNQHITCFTCSGRHARPVRSRLSQMRLHHVFASSPKVLGPAWQVWTSCFLGPDFGESVLSAALHRSQHWPGSPKQAQTWPDGSTYSMVQGTPAFAGIRPICFGLWCAKNGLLNLIVFLIDLIRSNVPKVYIICLIWPNARKVPEQHITYLTCSGWHITYLTCSYLGPKIIGAIDDAKIDALLAEEITI